MSADGTSSDLAIAGTVGATRALAPGLLPGLTWQERLALIAWQYRLEPSLDCPVTHIFSPGQYTRVMRIPAGTLFLGRTHLKGHEVFLIEGRVLHIDEHGQRERVAPYWVHTVPGYQMVVASITDVIARSVHPNPGNSRDIARQELKFFEPWRARIQHGERIARRLTHQEEALAWQA